MNLDDPYYPVDHPDKTKRGKPLPGFEGTLMGEGGVNNEATITELLNINNVKKCKSGGGCN